VTTIAARKRKYRAGRGVKPRGLASGVKGGMTPIQTTRIVVMVIGIADFCIAMSYFGFLALA
jgi:hypothetical protein